MAGTNDRDGLGPTGDAAPGEPIDSGARAALGRLRALIAREKEARERAEAQQIRLAEDFQIAYRRAVDLAVRLDRAYWGTIGALARAIEARDDYTGGHIERVRAHTVRMAGAFGLDAETLRQLEFGAVLHDVGKIGVPDAVLGKQGTLDLDEWRQMRAHPEIGRRMLAGVEFLGAALDAVAYHHERWDGAGYPAGLAGEDIPLAGRIVAVADAFDAMTTDRPYRAALAPDAALAEIERGRGTHFDPTVAGAFLAVVRRAA